MAGYAQTGSSSSWAYQNVTVTVKEKGLQFANGILRNSTRVTNDIAYHWCLYVQIRWKLASLLYRYLTCYEASNLCEWEDVDEAHWRLPSLEVSISLSSSLHRVGQWCKRWELSRLPKSVKILCYGIDFHFVIIFTIPHEEPRKAQLYCSHEGKSPYKIVKSHITAGKRASLIFFLSLPLGKHHSVKAKSNSVDETWSFSWTLMQDADSRSRILPCEIEVYGTVLL
jgi:hypothetical protein